MAISRSTSLKHREQLPAVFADWCEYHIQKAEEQRVQAREMTKRALEVRDRAEQMRKTAAFRETRA